MTWKMKMTEEIKLPMGYNGYQLTDQSRDKLMRILWPIHPDVIAHHVTHEYGVYQSFPPDATSVRMIAIAADDKVQAAIVEVNGISERLHGNSFYHITISIDKSAGGKAVDSNTLIKDRSNWVAIAPVDLAVIPVFITF
tara:strand:- start:127 stop:543 length:417 start_codon:yes stop_codon:yes gene_type:complete